jgi:tRNA pseudouridine55 synthase
MSPFAPQGLDGALVIDKPDGLTSHDVVAAVRRAIGAAKVGHTGTLDPMATGVLPLLLGRATRLAQYLAGGLKTYEARVRLGWATDTYDRTGRPISTPQAAAVTMDEIEHALRRFRGTFGQRPPAISAKKIDGRRAYALARGAGSLPELRDVQVTVHALTMEGVEDDEVALRVTASAGFYVRSLAHDLGQALGCGAHLTSLRRTASGSFGIDQAVPLERVLADPASARGLIVPPAALLPDWPVAVVTAPGAERVGHGSMLTAAHVAEMPDGPGSLVRIVDRSGALLALARRENGPFLQPLAVLM